jgi:hypothetical protein
MTRYGVNFTQSLSTTVYVDAPDEEAAQLAAEEFLAEEGVGDLCAQDSGYGQEEWSREVDSEYEWTSTVEVDS